jgi:hypothetical protein
MEIRVPANKFPEMKMYRTLLVTMLALTPALSAQINSLADTFANDQLTLTLQENNGRITGQVQLQGQSFPVTAQRTGNNSIRGTYQYFGQDFPFEATVNGNVMTLTSEGVVYTLHKKQNTAGPLAVGAPATATSQNPNEIIDKESGVRFTLPNGWAARKIDAGYLLGSQAEKGFIVITGHEYASLEQMRAEAQAGIVDESGTNLQLVGKIMPVGNNGLAAAYQGTMEGQPAKAFAVSILSPLGGGGSTILAAVEPASYSEKYAEHAKAIAASMKFFKPETPPIAEQWKRDLSGVKLTYLWSYYSGASSDGSYAGGSQKTEIHLCPQGFFKYYDSNQMAIDGGYSTSYNASAYGGGKDQGNGMWEVIARGQTPILKLTFHDGRTMEFQISYENKKSYLNGQRYFRTTASSDIPDQRPQCW